MTSLLLSALVFAAPLPEKDEGPKGPPPQVILLSQRSNGAPVVHLTVLRQVPVTRIVTVQEGNKLVQRPETSMATVSETVALPVDNKDLQVFGIDGKKIDPKDVRSLIKGPTPALLSADGKPVDPFYLRLAKEGTLVFVRSTPEAPLIPPAPPKDR
jgi:hypothetical protein